MTPPTGPGAGAGLGSADLGSLIPDSLSGLAERSGDATEIAGKGLADFQQRGGVPVLGFPRADRLR